MKKVDIEVKLTHDGQYWLGHWENLLAKGENLDELDENLVFHLQNSGKFPKGSKIEVFMGFDFDTIPTWLRQYHTHYFNRYVTLEL